MAANGRATLQKASIAMVRITVRLSRPLVFALQPGGASGFLLRRDFVQVDQLELKFLPAGHLPMQLALALLSCALASGWSRPDAIPPDAVRTPFGWLTIDFQNRISDRQPGQLASLPGVT